LFWSCLLAAMLGVCLYPSCQCDFVPTAQISVIFRANGLPNSVWAFAVLKPGSRLGFNSDLLFRNIFYLCFKLKSGSMLGFNSDLLLCSIFVVFICVFELLCTIFGTKSREVYLCQRWNQVRGWVSTLICCFYLRFWVETRFDVGFNSDLLCIFFNSVQEMFWRYHLRNVWIPIIVCIVLFCLWMLVTGCRSGSLYVSILPEKDFGPRSQNLRLF